MPFEWVIGQLHLVDALSRPVISSFLLPERETTAGSHTDSNTTRDKMPDRVDHSSLYTDHIRLSGTVLNYFTINNFSNLLKITSPGTHFRASTF